MLLFQAIICCMLEFYPNMALQMFLVSGNFTIISSLIIVSFITIVWLP